MKVCELLILLLKLLPEIKKLVKFIIKAIKNKRRPISKG